MKKGKRWDRMIPARRKTLFGIIGVALAILVYVYGVDPLLEARKLAEEEITVKRATLKKYAEVLRNRRSVEEALDRTRKQEEEMQRLLLPGETPQLGAAGLQEIVGRLAGKNGITLRSFRILEPKDVDSYRRISLQIELNPIGNLRSLAQFLTDMESQEKALVIPEMDLVVFNPRTPSSVQGSLVVAALMKGEQAKEKVKAK